MLAPQSQAQQPKHVLHKEPMLTASRQLTRPHGRLHCQEKTAAPSFPPNNFRHFLTLFSKFFASFPHGTCSLSVSHQYLALDGIYHLFGLQSQANRLVEDRPYGLTRGTDGIVTLSDALFQGTSPRVAPGLASVDYNPTAVAASLQSGLVPLHSPLLRESLLVSFPPLSYMLKFSGSSCLI